MGLREGGCWADRLFRLHRRRKEIPIIDNVFDVDAFLSTSPAPRAWTLSVTSLFRLGTRTTRLSLRPISRPAR